MASRASHFRSPQQSALRMRRGLDSEGLSPLAAAAAAAAVLGRGLKCATLIFASLLDLCTWFQKASIKGLSVFSCQK